MKALLILNLEILLLAPMCVQQKVDRGLKSADQYWTETGLGSQELESLLSDESCHSEYQSFLGCVNAIGQIAEKYNLALATDGQLKPISEKEIEERTTEKKDLSKWLEKFGTSEKKYSFLPIWKKLDSDYVRDSERASMVAVGINGFLSIYKDPHTYIMPLAMYEEVVSNSESRNSNAGFVARRLNGQLVVRKVYEGSPAAKAGIRRGDRILSINGDSVSKLLPYRVSDLLKMRSVDQLNLKVLQNGEQKYLTVVKSESLYPSVISRIVNDVGLLTIHKFSKNVCSMTRKQLIILKEQNIRGLMLDLRDNPGGQVEEAACVTNLFIRKGTLLFETRYLDASRTSDQYIAEDDVLYKGPMAVLINSGSASAAEIVAGALREQGRAKLVGERSFGKGSFQDGRIWGANPKIALFQTEGLYYFPSGWTPQLVGLQPDIPVNFNITDSLREEDLFLNPLIPADSWAGPQTLSWLNELECEPTLNSLLLDTTEDDPQLRKAQAFLTCGEKNDRHGSL